MEALGALLEILAFVGGLLFALLFIGVLIFAVMWLLVTKRVENMQEKLKQDMERMEAASYED